MKLGEALAQRKQLRRELHQAQNAMVSNHLRYEDDEPSATSFLDDYSEFARLNDEIYSLSDRIMRTNNETHLTGKFSHITIAQALITREIWRAELSALQQTRNTETQIRGNYRYGSRTKEDLKFVSDLDYAGLEALVENSRTLLNELDLQIQEASWTTELIE